MVLFVGLALMLVLTVGGLAVAQTALLELRMVRNAHDVVATLHAAEAALAEAEARLDTARDSPDRLVGVYPALGYGERAPWRDAAWSDSDSLPLSRTPAGVSRPPRYMIEHLATIEEEDDVPAGGPDTVPDPDAEPPILIDVFRVTARSVGDTGAVVLQTTFARSRGPVDGSLSGRLSWADLGA